MVTIRFIPQISKGYKEEEHIQAQRYEVVTGVHSEVLRVVR